MVAVAMIGGTLAGCAGAKVEQKFPSSSNRELSGDTDIYSSGGPGLFGSNKIFSSKKKKETAGSGIGVNAYIWRAALDTVSFMPIASADPFGGTIFTDWYEDPATPGERYKLNVLILDRDLKVDSLRVNAFKQVKVRDVWQHQASPEGMSRQLEDSILTRARQMRAKKSGALD